ncbi:hypothetical protein N7470_004652 [Penicillium chermesinum]|nr:hypothetical protein N7470_004652 [Penicillium chermesinum]
MQKKKIAVRPGPALRIMQSPGPIRLLYIPSAPSHSKRQDHKRASIGLISSFVENAGNQAARAQTDQHESGDLSTPNVKDEELSAPSDSFGQISLQDSRATYVQDTHWTAILDEITELKNTVQTESLFEREHSEAGQGYLNLLPGGAYERFWENQSDADPIWVGKMYGLMSLALIFRHQAPLARSNADNMIRDFNRKINRCLVLGRYEECPPGTIETLCCLMNSQFHYAEIKEMSHVLTMGIIIRLAQRMGYHRDASHFPNISPFNGEMRRRVWMLIMDLDTMLSLSVGLPRLLREFQSDSAMPRNLLDTDFDEDTVELPPSRPPSFEGPCQWLVSKHRVTSIYGIITDFSTSIRRPSYAEVMHLDKLLCENIRVHPRELAREALEQVSHGQLSGHHPSYPIAALSVQGKMRVTLSLLSTRKDRRAQETEPGGRFWRERWKIASPIMRETWVMGSTLLCLELNFDLSDGDPNSKRIPLSQNTRKQIISALRKSRAIWYESNDTHSEPKRAMKALDVVFDKVHKQDEATSRKAAEQATEKMGETVPNENLSADFLMQDNEFSWPELESAMFLNQSISVPNFETDLFDSPFTPSDVAPDLSGLTNSVDEMLGVSMNYPRFDH